MAFARLPLIDAKIGNGYYIWLKLMEEDGWWPNDNYGWWDINSSSQNYWTKNWAEPFWSGGEGRCGYQNSVGAYTCPWYVSYGVHFWEEINFNVAWNPAGLPAPPYQGIVGPTSLYPYQTYQWSAENLYNGTGPYSHQWYVDDAPFTTDAVLSTSFGPSSQHNIYVEVTDPTGYHSTSDPTFTVTVNTGTCAPEEINCYETLRAAGVAKANRLRPQPRIRQH